MIFISTSPKETKEIAQKIIKETKTNVISLEGELGGGKTTFVKGVADFFSIKEKIKSPTFFIMKKYDIKNKKQKFKKLYHFDAYRVKGTDEILDIGFKEIIQDKRNLVLVEWGDKVKNILPKDTLHIKFDFVLNSSKVAKRKDIAFRDENKRKITIK